MEEIWDIFVALLALVLAFNLFFGDQFIAEGIDYIESFIILLFTIGIGFIAHEMAHKWVAIRFGAAARFVLWPQGILLLFLFAILKSPIIFAATGAVYIYKVYLSKKENGLISLAGPAINIALCVVFFIVLITAQSLNIKLIDIVRDICNFGIVINSILAAFNLLPMFVLDGKKIISWNFKVWILAMIIPLIFLFIISPVMLIQMIISMMLMYVFFSFISILFMKTMR